MRGGCGDLRGERGKEAWDRGFVVEVGLAEAGGEEGFFSESEADFEDPEESDREDSAAGWHEDRDADGVEQRSEIEGIARAAVGAIG